MTEIEILKYYDLLYYNEGTPTISDEEYDLLKEEAKKKYPDNPYFSTVGAPIDGSKVKLPYILGSLEKIKIDTVNKWFEKRDPNLYMATSKLDGISIFVMYKNRELVMASTRGNGYEGRNILEKAKIFCPKPTFDGIISLRGEATLLGDGYKKVGYKNRRNGAAGILNKKDNIEFADLIHPIFYEIVDAPSFIEEYNEIEKLLFLKENGFNIPLFQSLDHPISRYLISTLEVFKERASEDGYDIDGLVIKPLKYERENVYYPKEMVAFKMNEKPVEAKVREVIWQLSRMGKFKPVVSIDPVIMDGVSVSRATGFNAEFIVNNGIEMGSVIQIVRSGDVIPHIVGVTSRQNAVLPRQCPYCGSEPVWKGVDIVCGNPECMGGSHKRISYFLRKLGAENITETTIRNLGITTIEECYEIDEFDIAEKDGFGINKGEQFVNEVQKTLKTKPEKLIAALGIDGIGETVSKLIVDHFNLKDRHTFEYVFDITADELESVEGIGPITAKKFVTEIQKYTGTISFMFYMGLQFDEEVVTSISGKIFTLTGKGPMSRQNIESMITSNGGLVKSMSKKSNYLVTNDVDSQSSKAKKARQYGVPMISYEDLLEMLK